MPYLVEQIYCVKKLSPTNSLFNCFHKLFLSASSFHTVISIAVLFQAVFITEEKEINMLSHFLFNIMMLIILLYVFHFLVS